MHLEQVRQYHPCTCTRYNGHLPRCGFSIKIKTGTSQVDLQRDPGCDGELVRPPMPKMLRKIDAPKPKKLGQKKKLDAEWQFCSHLFG